MRRLDLLNEAILVAPSSLPRLDDYLEKYKDTDCERLDFASLVRLFSPRLTREFLVEAGNVFSLSNKALKLLLILLPRDPVSQRLKDLSKCLHLPKKKCPKAFFKGRNVVYMGFAPVAGKLFSAILQDVPNLSASWANGGFGIGIGIDYPPLLELYSMLEADEIRELCLPTYEEYERGRLIEIVQCTAK